MQQKEVLLFLVDQWADWESSYAVWLINSVPQYAVKTISFDKLPKTSLGGVRAELDYDINEYTNFGNLAMIILTGGQWRKNRYEEVAEFIRKARELQIPVSAICGAVVFLGKHGFLDNVKHTGNDLKRFQSEPEYKGQEFFIPAQAVADQGFITANDTAALEFAREIFRVLKIDTDEEMDEWYNEFKHGAVR